MLINMSVVMNPMQTSAREKPWLILIVHSRIFISTMKAALVQCSNAALLLRRRLAEANELTSHGSPCLMTL